MCLKIKDKSDEPMKNKKSRYNYLLRKKLVADYYRNRKGLSEQAKERAQRHYARINEQFSRYHHKTEDPHRYNFASQDRIEESFRARDWNR